MIGAGFTVIQVGPDRLVSLGGGLIISADRSLIEVFGFAGGTGFSSVCPPLIGAGIQVGPDRLGFLEGGLIVFGFRSGTGFSSVCPPRVGVGLDWTSV